MNQLVNSIVKNVNQSIVTTENGAKTNASSLSNLVDMFYHLPARRGKNASALFSAAYAEDSRFATVLAFYTRNPRGGQGERQLFKDYLGFLYKTDRERFYQIFKLVPQYGRFDDLFGFLDDERVVAFFKSKIMEDITLAHDGQPYSLLAKWLPSENASSVTTIKLARKFMGIFRQTPRQYRQMLTQLRAGLRVTETLMSANQWDQIEYAKVASKAHTTYRKAFGKHSAERYAEYLNRVKKGEETIKASVLYPYDLVNQIETSRYDATIQAQWDALPNYANTDKAIMAVVDLSGSMRSTIPNTKISCWIAAVSMGLYLAQKNKGQFHNVLMSFDNTATFITLNDAHNLQQNFRTVQTHHTGMGTNVQSVFDELLKMAVGNRIPQSDMPEKIFIFSDMQFNAVNGYGRRSETNFEAIQKQYARAGYEMPQLVFWNLQSRVDETPVTKDESGAMLVGGLSPSVMKNALNGKITTPMDLMMDVINDPLYAPLLEAMI